MCPTRDASSRIFLMYLPAVIPTHTLHHFSLCILVIINICHNICAYIHTNCVVFLRLYLPNSYIAGQVLPTSQLLGCQNGPSVFRIEFVFGCMSQLPVNLVGRCGLESYRTMHCCRTYLHMVGSERLGECSIYHTLGEWSTVIKHLLGS